MGCLGADLEEKAFPQVAGPHAGRLHPLDHRKRRVELAELGLPEGGIGRGLDVDEVLQRHRQIAVGIEVVDHLLRGLPHLRTELVVGELLVEMVEERLGALLHVGHGVEVAVGGLVDPGGGRAAAVVVRLGVVARPVVGALEIGLVGMVLIDDERPFGGRPFRSRIGGIDRRGEAAGFAFRAVSNGGIAERIVDLEGLVVLDLLLDPLLKRHRRQLQDFHRLDHAWREHLLLRQPHFLAERHPHGTHPSTVTAPGS